MRVGAEVQILMWMMLLGSRSVTLDGCGCRVS
jgi:hypothetical protein